ncbi:MAG TPA: hypothetical protein VFH51_01170, partial [Myxococcota bacterium]|nr:hypothetical protein [Myxococcota bacterium]
MAEQDDRRVEARLGSAGRGLSANHENIEALRQRQAQQEKLTRPPPSQPFSAVLGAQAAAPATAADKADEKVSSKEAKWAALPKAGPRPSGPRGRRV